MRVMETGRRFIYDSSRIKLLALTLAISFVKTGVWYMPNFEMWSTIRLDPFHNPFVDPEAHYLFWNWLSPFIAWRFHIHNERSFLYFHLLFSIAFTFGLIWHIFTTLEERQARSAFILFVALPASATAYFWVGMDSVTLALMLLVIVLRRFPSAALLGGVLLGMQHAEQGLFAFGAVFLATLLSRMVGKPRVDGRLPWAVASLLGVALGKLILVIIFHHYEIAINSGRPYYLRHYAQVCAELFYYHFQYVLWSMLGVIWIVVSKVVERGKQALPFLVALACSLLLLPVVSDETRVLAIVTFPLVSTFLLLDSDFLRSLNDRFVCWIFGIWVLVPWSWAFGGRPLVSIFPFDGAYVFHHAFGWFNVPVNQPMWPF
jgi:hypothetical protein